MSTALTSTRSLREVDTVKEMLANVHAAKQLHAVAASHLNPERLMRTLALAVSKTPLLGKCTPMSLLGATMQSVSLGLEPNSVMGHSYLIPFKNNKAGTYEATLVIGYRGYQFLAANAGVSVHSAVHYSSDPVWRWSQGASPDLVHEAGDGTGDMLHAYAVGIGPNGFKAWVCWPEAKLVAHRDRYSKGYANDIRNGKKATDANVNIWIADPELARRKTMVRQLAKVIPMAVEMARAEATDGAHLDYARFAMDPSAPPEIAEAEHVDAEVVEEEDEAQRAKPDAGAADALAEARAKAAAKAKENRSNTTPYAERGQTEAKPAPVDHPMPTADWTKIAADMRASLLDLSPERAEEVYDTLTDEETTAFKNEAPTLWSELCVDITARANEGE